MNDSAEGSRMAEEIISWSISTKVWDRAGIELATPGSAVSFASVTRHVTDCATRPDRLALWNRIKSSLTVTSFVDSLCFFLSCLVSKICFHARLFICALWSPAGKGLTSWLSFVVSNCDFVTFPLVSWVRCGTWLNRFLFFAPLLTLTILHVPLRHCLSNC